MRILLRSARIGAAAMLLGTLAACTQTGGLGNILGSVLGGQSGNQVSGTIRSVDTRYQQITLQQSNGQNVAIAYDNNTQVVYQNRNYNVSSLEYGDQVTMRLQQTQNGQYYTDLVQVDQSVSSSNSSGSVYGNNNGQVQTLQGNVRRIDYNNGLFDLDANNTTITVSMPYNPSRNDQQRFQSLRNGDYVRFGGVFTSNNRVQLRQFY